MQHGDIANTIVPRWIITLDAMTDGAGIPRKRLWRSWENAVAHIEWNRLAGGALWRVTDRLPVIFEMAAFTVPPEVGPLLSEALDALGVHPIRYVSVHSDRDTLRASLPYRPEVKAVIDTKEQALFWGRYGMTLGELTPFA